MSELTPGAQAVANGLVVEDAVESFLRLAGFTKVQARTLEELMSKRTGLFPERGCFARGCTVPLTAGFHAGHNRRAKVDFVVYSPAGEYVLISTKSQQKDGSAEEKLEYEIQQLIASERPAAMWVFGPIRREDGKVGFRREVLEQVWERSRYYGGSRLLLFRKKERLAHWIGDGLSVGGRGRTATNIFDQYCDREP